MALSVALALASCRGGGGGAASSASSQSSASAVPSARAPAAPSAVDGAASGPVVRIDPLTMKLYRAELCLFATLGLRHLREVYLGSLHGAEPGQSPGLVPSFDKASHVDHPRQARTCALAFSVKAPAIAAIDEPLAAFGPLAAELAEEIAEGSEYYALEQYERDAFAKGKANHKKLVGLFATLDSGQNALAAGIDAYRAAHPVDLKALEEGERATTLTLDAGHALVLALVGKADSGKVVTPLLGSLQAAAKGVDERAKAHPEDPWSRAAPAVAALEKVVVAAAAKGAGSDALLRATYAFATLVEVAHLARASALLAKAKEQRR